jgi:putative FmdB family regulatory protein
MPIYEYTCSACSRLFEQLVMSRTEEVACPGCGSSQVEKAMSVCCHASGGGDSSFSSSSSASSGGSCGGCSRGSCSGCGSH